MEATVGPTVYALNFDRCIACGFDSSFLDFLKIDLVCLLVCGLRFKLVGRSYFTRVFLKQFWDASILFNNTSVGKAWNMDLTLDEFENIILGGEAIFYSSPN